MHILFFGSEALFADCLEKALPEPCRVSSVATDNEAVDLLDGNSAFDLVLINMNRIQQQGLSLLRHVVSGGLLPNVLVISEDPAMLRVCRDNGAVGGIRSSDSSASSLYETMRAVKAGMDVWPEAVESSVGDVVIPHLTSRQLEVLGCMADGFTNRMIGEKLGIKEVTVKTHVTAICDALHERNRSACVARSRDFGIIS